MSTSTWSAIAPLRAMREAGQLSAAGESALSEAEESLVALRILEGLAPTASGSELESVRDDEKRALARLVLALETIVRELLPTIPAAREGIQTALESGEVPEHLEGFTRKLLEVGIGLERIGACAPAIAVH